MTGLKGLHLGNDHVHSHQLALVVGILSITVRAAQMAARRTNENGWPSDERRFTLNTEKNLIDL
jgi:hypothetical protein